MRKENEDIINYLDNNLSAEDKKAFEQQMDESPDLRKEVEDFAFIWRTSGELKLHKKVGTARNWDKVSNRIKKDRQKKLFLKYVRNAAAILLLPVLVFSSFLFFELKDLNNKPVQQMEAKAATGLVSKIILPDGSEVWLNSGSLLSYPQLFRGERRKVTLTGEAYFKVKSDKSNPFDVVLEDGFVVSAYGTEFNINAYTDNNHIDVTLVKGNVNVSNSDTAINQPLNKGQRFSYNKADKSTSLSDVNLFVETAWKDGQIVFRRTSMEEVVRRLSRHFNADIRLEGRELYDYEYSATFTNETLPVILDLLSRTAPIEYKIIEPKSINNTDNKRKVVLTVKK